MKGVIDSIEEKKARDGKSFHIYVINGVEYSRWDAVPVEVRGQQVEFDFKESGKWKNITELKAIEGAPLQKQTHGYNDSKIWNTCLMCAKDIMVALISLGAKFSKEEIKDAVIGMSLAFYRASEGTDFPKIDDFPEQEKDDSPEDQRKKNDGTSSFAELKKMVEETSWTKEAHVDEWLLTYQEALQGCTIGQQRIIIALTDQAKNLLKK